MRGRRRDGALGTAPPWELRAPTRRQMLAGTLLLALAACADGNAVESGFSPAEDALRRQTAADEQRLLAAYAATAARHPDLAGRLAVPWQQHREHAARLAVAGASATPDATASNPAGSNPAASNPATSSAPSKAAPPAPPAPAVPAGAGAAVRALADLERSVAAARRQACATAGRGLAPLLGTLAAAELVHADVLLDGVLDQGIGGRVSGGLDGGPA